MEHTKWMVQQPVRATQANITDSEGIAIAQAFYPKDAEQIVRDHNSHDALVTFLTALIAKILYIIPLSSWLLLRTYALWYSRAVISFCSNTSATNVMTFDVSVRCLAYVWASSSLAQKSPLIFSAFVLLALSLVPRLNPRDRTTYDIFIPLSSSPTGPDHLLPGYTSRLYGRP